MFKVFLVEDEFVVREGIKNNVDWAAHGYEFCGEAGDGELAFPMIKELRPDIVITDIRMPFMDGLDLSRLIKKELPSTEILILSGYEEFDYAKEAIRIGVAEYLTKPVSGEELLKAVDSLADRVRERQYESVIREKYEHEMEENTNLEKRKLFDSLVTGTKKITELIDAAASMDISLTAKYYRLMLLLVSSTTHALSEYSRRLVWIDSTWKKLDEERKVVAFDRGLEGKAVLLKGDSAAELDVQQKEYLEGFMKMLEGQQHVRFFGGVSRTVARLSELPEAFIGAGRAFAKRYTTDESAIVTDRPDDEDELKKVADIGDFDIRTVNPKMIDRAKLKDFMRFADENEIGYFVDDYIDKMGSDAVNSYLFRQYLAMDAYFSATDVLESMNAECTIPAPDEHSGIHKGAGEVKRYISDILQRVIEARKGLSNDKNSDVTEDAIRYIEENYANDELSLNMVAAHVNFSPSYLSMLFGQATGKTLTKYITDVRMNKAKELLKCSSKKSSVIASEVGYKDPHYFSYLFRKTQGMTPTRFRGGNAEEE